ncbi:hypothetical protein [Streptosporangium roseum]
MLPTPKTRRFLPLLLMALALFFIVREPAKAATFATTVVEAFTTFASHLG